MIALLSLIVKNFDSIVIILIALLSDRGDRIAISEKYAGCARTVFYMGIVPFSIDVDILKYIYIWGVVAV
jgi:hypothetical protein